MLGFRFLYEGGSKDIFRMGGNRDGAGDLRRQVREVLPSRRAAGSLCLTVFRGGRHAFRRGALHANYSVSLGQGN